MGLVTGQNPLFDRLTQRDAKERKAFMEKRKPTSKGD